VVLSQAQGELRFLILDDKPGVQEALMMQNAWAGKLSVREADCRQRGTAGLSLFGHLFLWLGRRGPPQPKPPTTKKQDATQAYFVPVDDSTPVINSKASYFPSTF
jgi:hypothetical protein